MKIHNILKYAIIAALGLALGPGCATKQPQEAPVHKTQSPTHETAAAIAPPEEEPPLPEVTEKPAEKPLVTLAVIGDVNGRYGTTEYSPEVIRGIDMIIEQHPDIVINVGDMVAGQKPGLNYKKMWASFHEHITQRLLDAGVLMAQAVGNHDGSAYPKYEKERATYIEEWNAHKPELDYVDDAHYPLYYSFNLNGVFFVALDASTLDPLDDEQYAWLDQQLSANPSQYRPVVFFHVPLFPITTIKPTEILRDRRLPGLFAEKDVQLVLTGHQQAYFPAAKDGVIYVHSGALGGGPRPVRQNDGVAPKTLTYVSIYAEHKPYIETLLIDGTKGEKFNHNLLPTYIVFGNEILPRVDISEEDANFAHEYMISPHMSKGQMETLIDALRANDGDWSRIPSWMPENDTKNMPEIVPDSAAEETE